MTRLYDWDLWFKQGLLKGRFCLLRGKHYTCSTYSIGQQIRNAATRRGVKVSVYIDEADKVTVLVDNSELLNGKPKRKRVRA